VPLPESAPTSTSIAAWLLGIAVAAFWVVTALHTEPPYRPPLFADSLLAPASPADLPALPAGPIRIRLGFTGDLMQHAEQRTDDFHRSYALVAPYLRSLDLAVGNLEFPVDSTLPVGPDPGTVRFNGSTEHLDAIADAGLDVLQTANNHSHDRGRGGLLRTLESLRSRGLRPVGTAATRAALEDEPVVVEVGGAKVAFRAYTMPPNTYLDAEGRPEWVPSDLPIHALDFDHWQNETRQHGQALFKGHAEQARAAGAAFVVALVHWGREYYLAPADDQRRAAHDLVDAGFDLVVGTHSHVLGGTELYDGRLIAYSLGNFLSRSLGLETSVGAVLEVVLAGNAARMGVAEFGFRPTQVRMPGHVITPVDSARSEGDAAAWEVARRVLGPALVAWPRP
jgi:poly-gamma-glutamate capsule biosynthesis protein CapA/YwtB (metallophosphatase superfamily)